MDRPLTAPARVAGVGDRPAYAQELLRDEPVLPVTGRRDGDVLRNVPAETAVRRGWPHGRHRE